MAYPNYSNYQQYPMYNAQMVQPQMQMPQQMQQPVQQQVPQQMQSGGFMSIRSEQEARNYPVAPGNVVTFKIENQPYVCEKAQGFSQLEGPVFTKYKLVKEEELEQVTEAQDDYDYKSEIEYLKNELKMLKDKVYARPKTISRTTQESRGHKE